MLVPLPGMLVNMIMMIVYTMNSDVCFFTLFMTADLASRIGKKTIMLLLIIACRPSLILASGSASLSCTRFLIAVLALCDEAMNAARANVLLAVLRLHFAQVHRGVKSHGHSSPVFSMCLCQTQCSTQFMAVRHVLPAAIPVAAP